jgi:hypothetical protein
MHSQNSTITVIKKLTLFIFILFSSACAFAQENSPYSRYGVGDIVPSQNIVSRSMGGISAGFIDQIGFFPFSSKSINIANPASLGMLNTTIFDIAVEVDKRTLRSNTSPDKYTANNAVISYLQLGFPITPKKMLAKGNYWNIAFGLKPVSRINYKISANKRIPNIDSVNTLYEGSGGVNQVNFSTGIKIKNFSFGATTGYSFGNRQTSTRIELLNDSIFAYQKSNTANEARFGGMFLTLGTQYDVWLKNNAVVRFGATANLAHSLKGTRDNINETFVYNPNDGTPISIDTVSFSKDVKGAVKMPSTYTFGLTFTDSASNWVIGADVSLANWKDYSYFGVKDPAVSNSMRIHVGAQYYPANARTLTNKYWRFVKYRAGFYYGTDYVKLGSTSRPDYGITIGAGLPLTQFQRLRLGEFVMLNTGLEIGQRGSKQNQSLREGVVRFNFGIAMTASWFQKRKYD